MGRVSHAWSSQEPYIGYSAPGDEMVYAFAAGQVMSIAHGQDEELIVRLRHESGMETLYYNLADVLTQEGDSVSSSTCLGHVIRGSQALLEVRMAGRSMNPSAWLFPRDEP